MTNGILNLAMIFRLTGDLFHLYSIIILIQKIRITKSCSGLSLKTQILYMMVFVSRYVDVFFPHFNKFINFYNFIMKIVFLSTQAYVIVLMHQYKYTYDKRFDTLNLGYILLACSAITFFIKYNSFGFIDYIIEWLWAFSIAIETIAILPQLVSLRESGEAEVMTSNYIFTLGLYRGMYVINWLLKIYARKIIHDILLYSGIIQTLLYAEFFVLYYKFILSQGGISFKLPVFSRKKNTELEK